MALRGGTASKRIVKELAEVAKDLPENIKAGQRNESNIFEWYAQIRGPPNSVYEGGVFDINITIPPDYPFRAPLCQLQTRIYHMNINSQGGICLDILKNAWSPALSIVKVILSILSLLTDPNPSDPLVSEIAQLYTRNRAQHDANAREWTRTYAKPSLANPPVEDVDDGEIEMLSAASAAAATQEKDKKGKARARPSAPSRNASTANNAIVIDDDPSSPPASARRGRKRRADEVTPGAEHVESTGRATRQRTAAAAAQAAAGSGSRPHTEGTIIDID